MEYYGIVFKEECLEHYDDRPWLTSKSRPTNKGGLYSYWNMIMPKSDRVKGTQGYDTEYQRWTEAAAKAQKDVDSLVNLYRSSKQKMESLENTYSGKVRPKNVIDQIYSYIRTMNDCIDKVRKYKLQFEVGDGQKWGIKVPSWFEDAMTSDLYKNARRHAVKR